MLNLTKFRQNVHAVWVKMKANLFRRGISVVFNQNMMLKRTAFPAIIIAIFIVTSFGVISIGHILSNKPILFLNYERSYGLDYWDFFRASEKIIDGKSPYDLSSVDNNRYVTTPIPAIVNIVLVPLGFDNARKLLYFLIPLSLALGYQKITSIFEFAEADKDLVLTAGLVGLLFGYPFYFLVQRENIDGWVFLFLSLGLYWLSKPKRELISGLFFSLAIVFKIYPILIILPILFNKKWHLLLWIGLWLALWGIITLPYFSDLRTSLSMRSLSFFRFDENGSLMDTIRLISLSINSLGIKITGLGVRSSRIISTFIYGLLFFLLLLADYKLGRANKLDFSSYSMYLPFMIAVPNVVFHYSFIICLMLIPTMCYLWKISGSRFQRIIISIISIGIALTQWQAIATYHLTSNIASKSIPGIGLLIIMTGIAIFKILTLHLTMNNTVKV